MFDQTINIRKANHEKLVAAIKANGGKVVDDHTGKLQEVSHIGVLHFVNREFAVFVPKENSNFFSCSLNLLELAHDGSVHLTTMAAGGILDIKKSEGLEGAVAAYNAEKKLFDNHTLSLLKVM